MHASRVGVVPGIFSPSTQTTQEQQDLQEISLINSTHRLSKNLFEPHFISRCSSTGTTSTFQHSSYLIINLITISTARDTFQTFHSSITASRPQSPDQSIQSPVQSPQNDRPTQSNPSSTSQDPARPQPQAPGRESLHRHHVQRSW